MASINKNSLKKALITLFGTEITQFDYTIARLRGGTLGDLFRISGVANIETSPLHFDIVLKRQKKWDRFGDLESWRREYDIYASNFIEDLVPLFKLPKCLLLVEKKNLIEIWMEYIEGQSGSDQVHLDELVLAAKRLGNMQSRFSLYGTRNRAYLRNNSALLNSFHLWSRRVSPVLFNPIPGFPEAIRHVLLDFYTQSKDHFEVFRALPLTLCHGDFHQDNLIFQVNSNDTDIYLIDWDCCGYGYMGEDVIDLLIEAFVFTDRDVMQLSDYRHQLFKAYVEGIREYNLAASVSDALLLDFFVFAWGFRILDRYLNTHEEALKLRYIRILQIMLNMSLTV